MVRYDINITGAAIGSVVVHFPPYPIVEPPHVVIVETGVPVTREAKIYVGDEEIKIRNMNVGRNTWYHIDGGAGSPPADLDASWFSDDEIVHMKSLGFNSVDFHQIEPALVMNDDGSIRLAFYTNFIDKMATYCENNEMYLIIAFNRFNPPISSWNARGWWYVGDWFWDYGEGRAEPTTYEGVCRTIIDFYSLDVEEMDGARELYYQMLEFTADRYKDNPYVMISPRNEPQHFLYRYTTGQPEGQKIVDGYYDISRISIDRIRATGFEGLIFIEFPYGLSNYRYREEDAQNINRENIVYEFHSYMKPDGSKPYHQWSERILAARDKAYEFDKAYYVGEWHIDPVDATMSNALFTSQTEDMMNCFDDNGLSDSPHNYGRFYGYDKWRGAGWSNAQVTIYENLQLARDPPGP